MHAIEFETISYQHTIRLPDSVPDDLFLSVLVVGEVRQGIERLRRRERSTTEPSTLA